jgi:endonuclease/exonuclease/phosphatase family metal-dependent hydrolase
VIAVHFDWVQDDGFRFEQASETIDRIKTLETPWIVLGDFNDTPGSRTMDGFHAIGTEAAKAGVETDTFPSVAPTTEIDFILAGPAGSWRVGEAMVIDERVASDHRPVTATIRPN